MLAQAPARALANEHARGSQAHLCWPSSPDQSARRRTREMLRDNLLAQPFRQERTRTDTREAQGQVLLAQSPCQKRSRKDTRDAQGPGNTAFAAHPDAEMGAPFTTHFATGPRSPKRPLPPALLHDASNCPACGRRCPRPSRSSRIGPSSTPIGPSRLPPPAP